MDTALILQALDKEIGVLQKVHSILAGKKPQWEPNLKPKRVVSPESRKLMAAAQRKRWAKVKAA